MNDMDDMISFTPQISRMFCSPKIPMKWWWSFNFLVSTHLKNMSQNGSFPQGVEKNLPATNRGSIFHSDSPCHQVLKKNISTTPRPEFPDRKQT